MNTAVFHFKVHNLTLLTLSWRVKLQNNANVRARIAKINKLKTHSGYGLTDRAMFKGRNIFERRLLQIHGHFLWVKSWKLYAFVNSAGDPSLPNEKCMVNLFDEDFYWWHGFTLSLCMYNQHVWQLATFNGHTYWPHKIWCWNWVAFLWGIKLTPSTWLDCMQRLWLHSGVAH